MSAECAKSPEGHTCTRADTGHVDCMDDAGHCWDNEARLAEIRRGPVMRSIQGSPKQKIREMAGRVRPSPTADPIRPPGVPPEAVTKWTSTPEGRAWADSTYATLVEFCRSRSAPFTTPEDFWPLIQAPREMRAMSLVVQRAVRAGVMREDGAKRLRDTYRTLDGTEFLMNKLVPVYRPL